MPSLADTLEQLSSHSQQITQLAQLNRRPTGPFTSAYLESRIAPDLIRDSEEGERRLFKFIGETENATKKVEKREGLVTPLKDLQRGKNKGSRNEVEVVLTAVAKLVDDYRPMPRARSHIASLTDRHEQQVRRIAELEDLIAKLNNASNVQAASTAQPPSSPSPASAPLPKPKPVLSADEAIKAEEAALAAMEAMIQPHREAARATESGPSPQKNETPEKPPAHARAPPASPAIRNARPSVFNMQTPAKTPAREYPHISNSLVAGGNKATPYKSAAKMNRFTPLKNFSTPRASARERGSIFGQAPRSASGSKRISTIIPPTPIPAATHVDINDDDDEGANDDEDESNQLVPAAEDDTIRIPRSPERPLSPNPRAESPTADSTPRASPVKLASPIKGPREIHGVEVDNEAVAAATTRILGTATEIAQHTGPDDTGPETVITLLHHLSTASPEDVPGSDQSAASSALSTPSSVPTTRSAILQAHLCLLMLQQPTLTMTRNEAVERLTAFITEKQWGGGAQASKTVFDLVGKKTVTVDRKGAGGPSGTLTFQ